MGERLFPILGTTVPPMLGREAILKRLTSALTKRTPDHLQVVGPRFSGKTVTLHELARRMGGGEAPYSAVVMWDLGHQTPTSDEEFLQRLGEELASTLQAKHSEYAEYLRSLESNRYQGIAEVLEHLKTDECKVLAILDGFDKPLSNGRLSRNLWDQLRELALKPSLRLVTASRGKLSELLRSPEAQTSDFWGIFDPSPVRIGCFDEADMHAVIARLEGLEFSGGALTELWNATNGYPILLLEVLNVAKENLAPGPVSDKDVRSLCDRAFREVRDNLKILWESCPTTSQDLFRRVEKEQTVGRRGITYSDAEILVERGFVQESGDKFQRPSKLLSELLAESPEQGNEHARLFGDAESYLEHFRGVAERRIEHIEKIDPTLKRYLQLGISELPSHPEVFLSNVRGIVERGFELIWTAELREKRIPSEWMAIWKRNQVPRVEEWETKFPPGGQRVRLLQLMTGTERTDACAKHISKSTYGLMNAIHTFGDFGQHREGAVVDPGFAYAVLLLCIELAASLARELP